MHKYAFCLNVATNMLPVTWKTRTTLSSVTWLSMLVFSFKDVKFSLTDYCKSAIFNGVLIVRGHTCNRTNPESHCCVALCVSNCDHGSHMVRFLISWFRFVREYDWFFGSQWFVQIFLRTAFWVCHSFILKVLWGVPLSHDHVTDFAQSE